MKLSRCVLLAIGLLVAPLAASAADWPIGGTDWSQLPKNKQTLPALYMTPQQALDKKRADPRGVAFFDVRTQAEVTYVGMPTDADALIPYAVHKEPWTVWDDKYQMYKIEESQGFVPEVDRRIRELGLSKSSPIILICRSGDRSARAANLLQQNGYTEVYSVAEGFEGDMAKGGQDAGRRAVNGWKNAGLPWTYKLAKDKLYFPR